MEWAELNIAHLNVPAQVLPGAVFKEMCLTTSINENIYN